MSNFFKAILLGAVVGGIVGFAFFSYGLDMSNIAIGEKPLREYGFSPLLAAVAVFAFIGAMLTGSLLYKWEKFRFFIG